MGASIVLEKQLEVQNKLYHLHELYHHSKKVIFIAAVPYWCFLTLWNTVHRKIITKILCYLNFSSKSKAKHII